MKKPDHRPRKTLNSDCKIFSITEAAGMNAENTLKCQPVIRRRQQESGLAYVNLNVIQLHERQTMGNCQRQTS